MNPLSKLGGRKFALTLLVTALLSLLLVGGYISALIFRDLQLALFGAYFTSNVTQKVFAKDQAP
jgi:hypothetical protein